MKAPVAPFFLPEFPVYCVYCGTTSQLAPMGKHLVYQYWVFSEKNNNGRWVPMMGIPKRGFDSKIGKVHVVVEENSPIHRAQKWHPDYVAPPKPVKIDPITKKPETLADKARKLRQAIKDFEKEVDNTMLNGSLVSTNTVQAIMRLVRENGAGISFNPDNQLNKNLTAPELRSLGFKMDGNLLTA